MILLLSVTVSAVYRISLVFESKFHFYMFSYLQYKFLLSTLPKIRMQKPNFTWKYMLPYKNNIKLQVLENKLFVNMWRQTAIFTVYKLWNMKATQNPQHSFWHIIYKWLGVQFGIGIDNKYNYKFCMKLPVCILIK